MVLVGFSAVVVENMAGVAVGAVAAVAVTLAVAVAAAVAIPLAVAAAVAVTLAVAVAAAVAVTLAVAVAAVVAGCSCYCKQLTSVVAVLGWLLL